MNEMILFGMPTNPIEWVIILAVVMLLFGGSKLPQLAKALGQSKRAFKEGMDEADAEAAAADANKQREQISSTPKPALAAVDDEALFEEARRRAQAMRVAEVKQIEK